MDRGNYELIMHCYIIDKIRTKKIEFSNDKIVLLKYPQDPLANNTDLKSVTNSELLNLAVLSHKSNYFSIFRKRLL